MSSHSIPILKSKLKLFNIVVDKKSLEKQMWGTICPRGATKQDICYKPIAQVNSCWMEMTELHQLIVRTRTFGDLPDLN